MSIPTPLRRVLMRAGPTKGGEVLFLEDGLDRAAHAVAKLDLEILTKLKKRAKGLCYWSDMATSRRC